MKRVCLFAGYDSKGIIHDYVVYYLKELSTVSEVYYMADNEISDIEKEKIKPYVKGVYGFNHKKYDFGSWQELIKIIGWEKLYEYDELILANDSVFGPLYPMKDFFDTIENDKEWDVCGITEEVSYQKENGSFKLRNFLQSYFLIIKNNIFISNFFKSFFDGIKMYENKSDVVLYGEKGLSELFLYNGVVCKKFIEKNISPFKEWRDMVKYKSPFIKKSKFIQKNYYNEYQCIYNYDSFINKNTSYDITLINSYLYNIGINIDYFRSIRYFFKNLYENINRGVKKIFTINLKKYKKIVVFFGIKFVYKDIRKPIFKVLGK